MEMEDSRIVGGGEDRGYINKPWPLVKGNGFILVSELLPGSTGISVRLLRSCVREGANLNFFH
jgi:hypothetical protein